jgi:hypothetical protein
MNTWPELPLAAWRDTYATVLLYSQIVGKIRLVLTPKMNQWWNVPLYVTPRGLTTSPMPYRDRAFSIDFDFIDHQLRIEDDRGNVRTLPLTARRVCDFYDALFAELAAIDVHVKIHTKPQECPVTTLFTDDIEHQSYDRTKVHDFFEALSRIERVFQIFRQGKIDRDAYDEEVISLGFWPGDPWNESSEAIFYSYTVPEPPGMPAERVRPGAAFFSDALREYVLPYDQVRRSADPAKTILEFAQSTYDVGSTLAGWDRAALAYP